MAHLLHGQWVNSSDQISLTATGAEATNAQFQVVFLGNANSANAVSVTLPEGSTLTCGVLGLSYWDTATDNSIFFAEIKDSYGQLLPSGNEALFQDSFTGTLADLLYVNSVSGLDQIIVFRQELPSPTLWGMSPETTMLQVVTEFSTNGPSPRVIPTQTLGGRDDHLDWGVMQMPQGYAFAVGSETNKVPVTKYWLTTPDSRTCLIEQVPFEAVLPSIQTLPPPPSGASLQPAPGSAPHLATHRLVLPPAKVARTHTPSLKLAKNMPERKGYAMDFILTLTSSQTNFVFQSDTTYFITNNASVLLCGSNVFEGGTVIKYGTNASIQIYPSATTPSVSFYGSPYRPILFTSMDDSSAGDQIRTNAPSGYYASPALHLSGLSQIPNLAHVRFAFANQGIYLGGVSANISDAQFVNCQQGVSAGGSVIHFRNVLFANTLTNLANLGDVNATAENCTFNGSGYLVTSPAGNTGSSFSMTNSIVANISHILFIGALDATNGDYNGFFSSPSSFGTHIAPTPSGSPFQTVGAGNFYLAVTNYRGAGTATVDTNLLAELSRKTTWPPIVFFKTNFNASLSLWPQAPRDTNAAPDLGWHYDPTDFAFGVSRVTNAITVSINQGTVIAGFATNLLNDGFGLNFERGAQITALGTPLAETRFVVFNTVMEQPQSAWAEPGLDGIITDAASGTTAGGFSFRFADFSALAQHSYHMYISTAPANLQDCQFHGGWLVDDSTLLNATNCLFERVSSYLTAASGVPIFRNNTFFGGEFDFNPPVTNAIVKDNIFDHTVFGFDLTGYGYNGGFNAFVTGTNYLYPTNVTDIILTNSPAYIAGPLGNYYLPSNSKLINADTNTTADQVGLYHYTVVSNILAGAEIKETNSLLDLGYHSVAVDTNGLPIDTAGAGVPDYLADANGNGIVDPGERDWRDYYNHILPNLTIVSGNNQSAMPGTFLALPLAVLVTSTNGTALTNAPITFAVTQGGAQLAATTTSTLSGSISERTDVNAQASAMVFMPWAFDTNVQITATATTGTNSVQVTFTAYTLQGAILWLRADTTNVVHDSGNNVSKWFDQTTSHNDATSTSPKPILVTNAINGLPVVRFAAAGGYFSFGNFLATVTGAEAFVTLKIATNAPPLGLWRFSSSSDLVRYPDTVGSIAEDFGSSSLFNIGTPWQRLDQYHFYNVMGQTGSWTARINGEVQFSTTNNNYGFSANPFLGYGGFQLFAGDIGEMIVFKRSLNPTERDLVNGYLNGRYAFTGTPSAPSALNAVSVSASQISLTWGFGLGNYSTAFQVQRKTGAGGTYCTIATVRDATSFLDTNLTANITYYYRVSATWLGNQSGYSAQTSATTAAIGTDIPLTNLALWLKADTGVVPETTNTPTVSTWFDQSGSHNDASQITPSAQPSWVTNALNGLPVVRFSGNGQYLTLPNILTNTTGAEAMVVLKVGPGATTNSRALWHFGGSVGSARYPEMNGIIYDDFASTTLYTVGPPVQRLDVYHLYSVGGQAGSWAARLNGAVQTGTSNNAYGSISSSLGYGSGFVFDGDIAEVMIFNRTLTTDERDTTGSYLVAKYNLSQFATNSSPPGAPSALLATGIAPVQLNLSWNRASTNETSFRIERKLGSSGPYQEIGSVATALTNFIDLTAMPTNLYYYRAKACNFFGQSAYATAISPPTIGFTNPADLIMVTVSFTNSLSATATDANGTVSKVDFFVFTGVYGTKTSSPYTTNWIPQQIGAYQLSARATDSLNNSQFSLPVRISVFPDTDGDGLGDFLEIIMGTDPTNSGDPPAPPPNNGIAPNINLIEPIGATQLP
jgi:hypothetical protein